MAELSTGDFSTQWIWMPSNEHRPRVVGLMAGGDEARWFDILNILVICQLVSSYVFRFTNLLERQVLDLTNLLPLVPAP